MEGLLGYIIALMVVLWIVVISYKKKTGKNISELWKKGKEKVKEAITPKYQRVYVTRGIKT